MDINIINTVEKDQYKKRPLVRVGDTVKLHLKIKEGNKERIQIFTGVVISIKGSGLGKTLTVRKISYGVGVERIVPFNSNLLEKIEIVKRGTVKKSKLFFLRERIGRRALKIDNIKDVYMTDEIEVPVEGEAVEKEDSAE
ncbi:MAG: 50S ribosomal protein L19P, large subunit ribosomal protein L19 [candidate division WS6 bacterium GW2011_GWC1_33_20]|uniref:50S ribosomal protein L19 n=2 Tax=Candidatus Dojkabacteria TaxID=74243 RepID=A0A0G0AEW3_9BACT|nr:MAG: 50S ribosomal protein L19P, large subunit ribosomal protein L19 [candidate division WS6 bacterium GW2011_GWE2_33_157]KKP44189.1 MAG: 50S ribosomal protein L19P, large subunit ribosomal protein L19 [candidate division WS6 bacterium GW2011_GWC1_33_20]KKP45755.1 MAG: 50S ribosomal protein L19P, large subunit ribosomal protein L19 [candidate division WS6 bacterium GW2011_GWF1_33_233]KKP55083.1 MAG: 50S ribosomal protein L19 [candidate division WS6 bacterium GW2011_GWB1_33_6]KKP55198.1 MAG: 